MLKSLGQCDEKWGIYMASKCLPTRYLAITMENPYGYVGKTSRHHITLSYDGVPQHLMPPDKRPPKGHSIPPGKFSPVSEIGTSHKHQLRDSLPNS